MQVIIRRFYRRLKWLMIQRSNIRLKSDFFYLSKLSHLDIDRSSTLLFNGKFSICRYVIIFLNENSSLTMGDNVYVGDFSTIRGTRTNLTIGDNVIIGQHVKILATNHAFQKKDQIIQDQDIDLDKIGIEIGSDVWLGAGSVILPGVAIGNGVVVGANSVVTKSLPDYAVAVGNPARIIKYRL
jgi:acetyltransferase-like isoleucine patch superfamily enzyme